jgi:hypothetical protein
MTNRFFFAALLCLALTPIAAMQKVEKSGNVSKTATITAIDQAKRIVTLKDAAGNVENVVCGPEIKRFSELKVGDSVTFSYHAAVVAQVSKAGAAAGSTMSTVRGQGTSPSGAITHQQTASVTVEAIDAAAPSIKVKMADGHSMTAMVEDRKNLEGLKVGDKINITYTEAVMVVVEPAKK